MTDWQGDPRIRIEGDGAIIRFTDGQPEMDGTIENEIIIRLFTRPGWVGNMFAKEEKKLIGSDFESLHDDPMTSSLLIDIRDSALRALQPMLDAGSLSDLDIYCSNPQGTDIYTVIAAMDSHGDEHNFKITRNNARWIVQKIEA